MVAKNSDIVIRKYTENDKPALINFIRLNTPQYFAVSEEADFSRYLDDEVELYYVLVYCGEIIACGGINFADAKTTGKISWDMVHPSYQGKSFGSKLLKYRVELLKSMDVVKRITVRTSQMAYRFYEKSGFELQGVVKDYWAKGYDLYSMEYSGSNISC